MTSRRPRRGAPALVLAAVGLVLHAPVAVAATPGLADPTAAPTPPADVPDAPEGVTAWFAEEGAQAASSAGLGPQDDLTVGLPRQVWTWDEEFVEGVDLEAPAVPSDEWVAPVAVQSEDAPEPAGVVRVTAPEGSEPRLVTVADDAELAAALAGVPGAASFVYDDTVEGWFGTLDGEVWPVTEGARTVLQGALPVGVFQEFLAAWQGDAGPTAEPAPTPDEDAPLSPLVPIGIIVLLGGVAAWLLLRQYRRADSRIAADVHAGLAPPREDPPDEK